MLFWINLSVNSACQCFPQAFLSTTVFDLKIEFYYAVSTQGATMVDAEGGILKFCTLHIALKWPLWASKEAYEKEK